MGEISKIKETSSSRLSVNSKGDEIANFLNPSSLSIKNQQDDESIKQVLRYSFVLIGLRTEQIPNEVQRGVLIEYIKNNYSALCPDEIKIGFELAVKGELNIDANHYGNFSPLYFSTVINAYLSYKSKIALEFKQIGERDKRNESETLSETERLKFAKEFDEVVIDEIFKAFEYSGKLDLKLVSPRLVYNRIVEHGLIELTNEEKQKIKQIATEQIEEEKKALQNTKSGGFKDHQLKKKIIESFEIPSALDDKIRDKCYLIVIERAFTKLKEDGKKFLDKEPN